MDEEAVVNRGDRRTMDAALARLGRSLVRVRESGAWAAEGFSSFGAFSHARVAEHLQTLAGPAAVVDDGQVDELVLRALALAAGRRRKGLR